MSLCLHVCVAVTLPRESRLVTLSLCAPPCVQAGVTAYEGGRYRALLVNARVIPVPIAAQWGLDDLNVLVTVEGSGEGSKIAKVRPPASV